jgi:predicted GNAT superfamily acetyltransferase
VHNQYGTTSSRLHGGLPTDRLIAEWWIRSPRAEAAASRDAVGNEKAFERSMTQAEISVPVDIASLRERDPGRAREVQASIAAQFDRHFRAGLTVIGFEKSAEAGRYLLGSWESK